MSPDDGKIPSTYQRAAIERACYEHRARFRAGGHRGGSSWSAIGARFWPDLDATWQALKASAAASRHAARGGLRWPLSPLSGGVAVEAA